VPRKPGGGEWLEDWEGMASRKRAPGAEYARNTRTGECVTYTTLLRVRMAEELPHVKRAERRALDLLESETAKREAEAAKLREAKEAAALKEQEREKEREQEREKLRAAEAEAAKLQAVASAATLKEQDRRRKENKRKRDRKKAKKAAGKS
jgi:hypothetical protein